MTDYNAEYLRKQSQCVYLAAEESPADDLSAGLRAGADAMDRLAAIERQVRELADDKEAKASRLHDQGCELLASDEYEDADRLRAIIDAPDSGGEG